jgi:hypothetical protein
MPARFSTMAGEQGSPDTWCDPRGFALKFCTEHGNYDAMGNNTPHTYMWINGAGERFWVKYHFKTDQGVEYLTQAEADELAGQDGDKHRRDLRPHRAGRLRALEPGARHRSLAGQDAAGQAVLVPGHPPVPDRPHSPVNSYELVREATKLHREDDDFGQAGTMVREVLDPALLYWRHVDKELGDRIAANFE